MKFYHKFFPLDLKKNLYPVDMFSSLASPSLPFNISPLYTNRNSPFLRGTSFTTPLPKMEYV